MRGKGLVKMGKALKGAAGGGGVDRERGPPVSEARSLCPEASDHIHGHILL